MADAVDRNHMALDLWVDPVDQVVPAAVAAEVAAEAVVAVRQMLVVIRRQRCQRTYYIRAK